MAALTPALFPRPKGPPTPTRKDLLLGSLLAAGYFAILSAAVFCLGSSISHPAGAGWAALLSVYLFWGALAWGSVVAVIWGFPVGLLASRALARSSSWAVHVAAYSSLGALTGGAVWWLAASLDSQFSTSIGSWTVLLSAVSTGSAWLTVSLRSVRLPG